MTGTGQTAGALLKQAEEHLQAAGVPEPASDAWMIFEFVTGWRRADYLLRRGEILTADTAENFREKIALRCRRIPAQQIVGEAWFMGYPFYVNEHVLTPRADTECLAEAVLAWQNSLADPAGADLLDMCTGSGCIGISLGLLGEFRSVTLADISPEALAVAAENVRRLAEEAPKTAFRLQQSDLFSAFAGQRFHVITANPPYIPAEQISGLMAEVKDHEPHLALDGGTDGLDFYRKLAEECPEHLITGGRIFWEIGWDQGPDVCGLLQAADYTEIEIKQDLAGHDRVVTAVTDRR